MARSPNDNPYRHVLASFAAAAALGAADVRETLAAEAAPAAAAEAGAAKAPAFKAKVLARAELDALLAQPEKILVVDVRRPDEITAIGGFPVYLNIQPGDLTERAKAIPRDRVIVTVSNHAARAGRAADTLAGLGFKVAGAVGAQTYEGEGGTLVHLAPPPKAAGAPSP